MKIIKSGSVKVMRICKHDQSFIGSMFACTIDTSFPEVKYAKLSGELKVLIKLSADPDGKNPTVISTGESWKDYNYDDNITVLINKKLFQVDVVFFNKFKSKTVLFEKIIK